MMKPGLNRRVLLLCLFITGIIVIGIALIGRKSSSNIRFGLTPYQDTALPVVAQKMGWFTNEGIRVEFRSLGWGDVMTSLESGAIDASIFTFNAFQANYNSAVLGRKRPIFFCPIYVFKGTAIMVRQNSGIKPFENVADETTEQRRRRLVEAVRQLKGKRIAVTEGTEFEQIVLAALSIGGLDAKKDVQLINATPADALASFLSGDIDAFGAGLTERVEARRHGGAEFLVSADVGQPSIDGIVTTERFATNHIEVLDKFIRVWFKTIAYVGSNPATNSAAVRAYLAANGSTKYSPEEYAIAWTFNVFPDNPRSDSNLFEASTSDYYWRANWDANNKFLLDQRKIVSRVPYSAYWGTATLERLQKQ